MDTRKFYRFFFTLICLTLALVLTIGKAQADQYMQSDTDFADIDAYVTKQMNTLGIPGMALGII